MTSLATAPLMESTILKPCWSVLRSQRSEVLIENQTSTSQLPSVSIQRFRQAASDVIARTRNTFGLNLLRRAWVLNETNEELPLSFNEGQFLLNMLRRFKREIEQEEFTCHS